MSNIEPIEVKMILLGESGVGKTSIISRYVHDQFNPHIQISTTMCFVSKIIKKNNRKIKLNIWDTIGQERFRSISKLFLKDTRIVILVYSIISEESFKNLEYWLKLYKDILDEGTILGIAANKSDLKLKQEVPDDVGMEFAKKNGGIFGLISCKDKIGVDKLINNLIESYLNKKKNFNYNDNETIRLSKRIGSNIYRYNTNSSSSSCCSGDNKRRKRYNSMINDFHGCINSVFLGDKGVGKTSIINRLRGEKINENEEHTDKIKKFSIDYKNNNETKFKFNIYDVDNDKMKSLEFIEIIKKTNIFFLVYDVNNNESLVNMGYWLEVIKKCKEEGKGIKYLIYIIGNKNDKKKEESLNIEEIGIMENNDKSNKKYIEEGEKLSKENNGLFKAISALENRGINSIIREVIEKYLFL